LLDRRHGDLARLVLAMNESPVTRLPAGLRLPFDPLLALAAIGLMAASLVTLHTSTRNDVPGDPNYYVTRQGVFFALGVILAIVLSRVDYSRLRELKYGVYGLMMFGLFAVAAFGGNTRGSRRAIQTPLFEIQASELGKVLLAVALAAFIVDRARRLGERDTTARIVLVAMFPATVVMATDLGSGLVFIAILFAALFIAGVSWRHFAGLLALGAVSIALVLAAAPALGVTVLHGYQAERLTSFLYPSDVAGDAGYQQNQSRIAIGSGQKTGRGNQASQTNLDFLPEERTDFIFAVVGERWGFAGAGLVLSLYALLIWRGLRILTMAKNLYGALIAGGIVAMLLFQVFINVGMNVGIMPITGIPLPLLSYGGSSVIATLLAIGLMQSIYAQGRVAAATKGRGLSF
jgi:rod shape determining protein RodA